MSSKNLFSSFSHSNIVVNLLCEYRCLHTTSLLQACVRKQRKPRTFYAVENVVAEAELASDADDVSFDIFINRNADDMRRIVEENRQRFGYAFFLFDEK